MNLKNVVFLLVTFLFITSCQKAPELTMAGDSATIEFSAEGGTKSISFTANRDWTANCSEGWLHISMTSGSKSEVSVTVSVICDANKSFEERCGTVIIRVEDLIQTISVKQAANNGIELATQFYHLTSDGGTIEIDVKANVEYSIVISDNWIKQIDSKGQTSNTLIFSIDENDSYDLRKASISLKPEQNGVSEQVISVEQAQKDALFVDNSSFAMPAGGGIIELKVDANVDYDVSSTSSWIHLVETKGLNTSTVCLKVDASASEEREGRVWISQREGSITSIVTITQAAAPSFFYDLFTDIGLPCKLYNSPDDWEYLMMLFCNDLEGSDALIPESGYNWFKTCGEYSTRNNTLRNPAIRYRAPYNMISRINSFVSVYPENVDAEDVVNKVAQLRVLRAYSYMMLAPQFQFAPLTQTDEGIGNDLPCVPILNSMAVDLTNNPRATVGEVYALVMDDLDYAVDNLSGASRYSKMYIDANVAHGLRARVNLLLGNWDAAYADAVAAADGYTPATITEVSAPAFMDINEHNWIWGYDMAAGLPTSVANNFSGNGLYATTSSWLRSFSNNGYAPACQVYTCINKLLWDKIPATDVRKGWWVDENLESPLLNGLNWPGFNDVAHANDNNNKLPFIPYTNVKFGCNPIATSVNEEDMPLMRVEEMILIQAEAKAHTSAAESKTILENFVKTYRDPSYSADAGGRNLLDEIWFQRRVELWGEGFGVFDNLRLDKPIVRSHGAGTSNIAEAFRFNIESQDPWLRMRFPQNELENNIGLVDNTGGSIPIIDQNVQLRDGVTD